MPEFDSQSCNRIIKAVRQVEQLPRNVVARQEGPRVVLPVHIGITTTSITPRSGKTKGFGMVQQYDGNVNPMVAVGSPFKIYNWTGSTIATSIWVKWDIVDGLPMFDGNDCSGVTA